MNTWHIQSNFYVILDKKSKSYDLCEKRIYDNIQKGRSKTTDKLICHLYTSSIEIATLRASENAEVPEEFINVRTKRYDS